MKTMCLQMFNWSLLGFLETSKHACLCLQNEAEKQVMIKDTKKQEAARKGREKFIN